MMVNGLNKHLGIMNQETIVLNLRLLMKLSLSIIFLEAYKQQTNQVLFDNITLTFRVINDQPLEPVGENEDGVRETKIHQT